MEYNQTEAIAAAKLMMQHLDILQTCLQDSMTQKGALGYLEPEKYGTRRLDEITRINSDGIQNIIKLHEEFKSNPIYCVLAQRNSIEDFTQILENNLTSHGAASYYNPKEYATRRFETINTFCEEKLETVATSINELKAVIDHYEPTNRPKMK